MMDDPKMEDAKTKPTYTNHLCCCVYNSLQWTYFDACVV